jgi:hypothetical protein
MWMLDIADTGETPILQGVPMVTGADLLAAYRYLAALPPGQLGVATDGAPNAPPTFNNLGIASHLYYVVAGNPFEIPLQPTAQTFHISLSGVDYMLSTYWNTQS